MARVRVALLVALIALGPLVASAAAAPGPSTTGVGWSTASVDGGGSPMAAAAAPETDNTVTRIAVRANGDARWTVRIRTRLASESDVEDYEAFQRRFRNDTAQYRDPFAERIRAVVADAAEATGREMIARNVTASTSIQELPRRWGVVSFTFTWTNFARKEGPALVVGDAFEGGLLLAENDTLVVVAPPDHVVDGDGVDPEPDASEDDAVTWEGQRDFGDSRPRVRLVPATTRTPTRSPTGSGGAGLGTIAPLGLLAALALGGGAFLLWRRNGTDDTGNDADGQGGSGREGGPGVEGGHVDPDDAIAAPRDDRPMLTDGEKVERLVADAGGRMKQAAVAEELGWSDSKTSRVVSRLVDDDRVEKLRVGRENVLDVEDGTG